MDELLNYRLNDCAGGLWRRLWSLGYSATIPRKGETARQWLDRSVEVREIIQEIKTGRLNDASNDTRH